MVRDALDASGLAPQRLELEVTETALIEERDAATSILSALAKQGIGIALDDFGTGYSSLSYLQALPFTKLKVDRSFVMRHHDQPALADAADQRRPARQGHQPHGHRRGRRDRGAAGPDPAHTKVDQIQGFLFGVPLPRREVAELIARMAAVAPPPVAIRKQG